MMIVVDGMIVCKIPESDPKPSQFKLGYPRAGVPNPADTRRKHDGFID